MNTTELVVEMRPEKNSGSYGISTTSSVVFIAARISYLRFDIFWSDARKTEIYLVHAINL